ncbi:MAG: FtsX-like permease family protein [candidate division WOR-3 bacterium]|nr:FtsX-like permease family protein [candidate division WOR-3 bacterium]
MLILIIKNLFRRKIRTFLTILGIGIAIFLLFSLLTFNQGYKNSLIKELDLLGVHMLAVPKGCPYEAASLIVHGGVIPKYLKEEDLMTVRKIPEIEIATPIFLSQLVEEDRISIIYGIDIESYLKVKKYWKVKGRFFENNENDKIVIGSDVAFQEKLEVGDEIYFKKINKIYQIVGILEYTGGQDDGFYFLPLKEVQRIFDKESLITAIGIKVKNLERIDEVIKKLEEIPDLQIVTMTQVLGTILNLIGQANTLIYTIIILALFISSLGVINTMLISVFERKREIGLLKVIGANNWDIIKLLFFETLLLIIIGSLLGIILTISGSRLIETFIKEIIPSSPKKIEFNFDWKIAGTIFLYALIIAILASIYPILKAINLRPMETIRSSNE